MELDLGLAFCGGEQEVVLQRAYSHRVRQDLLDLSAALNQLPADRKALLCFAAIRVNLLKAPFWLRAMLVLLGWRYGVGAGALKYAAAIGRDVPTLANELWDNLMNHMTNGKDPIDSMSAGGWNKQSLDLFLKFVDDIGESNPATCPTLPGAAMDAQLR